ncbi:MAG: response regulator [Paludibacter sp.]|nr:response regulator [Paludibacter sp.]MCM1575542.1 response regulator [Bacteroides sp.]
MRNRTILAIGLLLSCTIHLIAQHSPNDTGAYQYTVKHYSVEDGLSQNTVMAILQDHDGYMWFGTWDGLNKFDGYNFTNYKSHPDPQRQMQNSRIHFIYEDSLNYIWSQTYDGNIHRLDKRTEKIYSLDLQVQSLHNHTHHLYAEPRKGELWFATYTSILRLQNIEQGDCPTLSTYQTRHAAHFLVSDTEGNIWFDDGNSLCRITAQGDSTRFYPYGKEKAIKYISVYTQKSCIWFGSDNGIIWRYSPQDKHFEHIEIGKETRITDIQPLQNGSLIFTTDSEGLFLYDYKQGSLKQYSTSNTPFIHSNNFLSVSMDNHGIVWIENSESGIFRYRISDQSLKHLQPLTDTRYIRQLAPNFLMFEDANHQLWLNPTGGGFSKYNYDSDELEAPIEGLSNMIHTAYPDKQGAIWISTYDQGIDRVDIQRPQFHLQDIRENIHQSGEVRATLQLRNGDILMANKGGKVIHYNKAMQQKSVLPIDALVYCMHEDKNGDIWFGTRGMGLMKLTLSANGHFTISQYIHTDDPYSVSCNDIYAITEDKNGTLYIGTYGGGINILRGERFIHYANEWEAYPIDKCARVRNLLTAGDSILWAATTNGLLQISIPQNVCSFTAYYDITHLHCDSSGTLWFCTYGAGLNKVIQPATQNSPAIFKAYTTADGLNSDIVLSIAEDECGMLWLLSENSITRFDSQSNTFQHFNALSHQPNAYFSESPLLHLQSGKMLAGYSNGYCSFAPKLILHSEEVPDVVLTKLQLFNKDVVIGGKGSPLQQDIAYTQEISLTHAQSVFSVEYAALDFANADKIRYAYILQGFEKEWNYVNTRKVTYTNLKPGTYHFCVRSTNSEGVWADNIRTLTIHIQPPFRQTGWAILLYVLCGLLLLYVAFRIFSSYTHLQQEIILGQKVTDIKLRFFTNISHELRTPLTLISGPVENILKTEKISPNVRTQLEIVESNCNRMLRLINEILDFRKIQNKKMKLKIQETKLPELVERTCANFTKEAYDKHINFQIENMAPDLTIWIDREKVDIILYNLLSNAFKFTPAGKGIKVTISEKNNFALLKVSDEGVGIPNDKRSLLFERFSSQNEIKNFSSISSTGIGLNLVKELVDMHKGYIEVDSEPNKGTTFVIMLRMGKDHFGSDVDFITDTPIVTNNEENPRLLTDNLETHSEEKTMLIVEDNQDMRSFLSNIFQQEFKVLTANDGKEGVNSALEHIPDIIISDLMMPNMDGLELTNKLKEDIKTSHIPIILLTAKSAIESKLEALRYGADDYITKPFSPEHLKARVVNLLKQRDRLQESYRNELLNLQPKDVKVKSSNEAFLAKLMDFMERNMDNSDLVVEDMVNEMNLGRTVFFNKLKGLTGLSPVEFIREVRIKRAAQLLETGTYNITEITYMVGMNDSRYFSKCFKAIYGMTPSEYKKKLTNK